MAANILTDITPVILTFNEEPNIGRALGRLRWAREVVVVDSGSTDSTLSICSTYPNVRVVHRPFDTHAQQWNFAVAEAGIATNWILALDADYMVGEDLVQELGKLDVSTEVSGFQTHFRYCVWGHPLRGTLYPPVTTVYRRAHARYDQDGHTQRIRVEGVVGRLTSPIDHDDRKSLARWLWAQERYATLEVDVLLNKPLGALRMQDRLRRMVVIAPWLVPLYCLTVGRGLLDGWPGMYYAIQRGLAESVLALKLIERHLAALREGNPH